MAEFAGAMRVKDRQLESIARRPLLTAQPSLRTVLQLRVVGRAPVSKRVASPISEIVSTGRDARSRSTGGLPPRLRVGVEALSGLAMDDVRVHRNSAEPAKLGAVAFTRGPEIHLGPGQEQHLPHEAWHVVQQKQGQVQATTQMKGAAINDDAGLEREADRASLRIARGEVSRLAIPLARASTSGRTIQRQKKAPTREESERRLGEQLREPRNAAGLTLAFYDPINKVAMDRAKEFAVRENALGFDGKTPTAANLTFGKSIDSEPGIQKVTLAVANLAAAALGRVPAAAGTSASAANAPAQIKTIAIFSHGEPFWIAGDVWTSRAPQLVKAIAPKLTNDVNVIVYACNVARDLKEKETWIGGTMESGGKKSLAAAIRDALVDEKITGATVWGNAASGNPSHNVTKRLFEAKAGKGAEGKSYASTYIFTPNVREAATEQLVETIRGMGFIVDEKDAKFKKAVADTLTNLFYFSFVAAGKELSGVNVAEAAPLAPQFTAYRVLYFWAFKFWPRNREKAAQGLARRLRLAKIKKP